MATTERESTLGEEKRGISPTNSSVAHRRRRPSPGSTEKKVPNYLKPTISSRNDATKDFKKSGHEDTSQRPNLLRRRSFDRPPSAAQVHKALISPGRERPAAFRSASFSSKATTAPKSTLERGPKKPNAGKPQALSPSACMKKTTSPTNKKGSTSSSNKPLSNRDRKEANLETKHENEANMDHQLGKDVKDDQGQIDDSEIPKAEESELSDVVDTTEVKSVEERKDTPADISAVSQEHNVSQTEEMQDKFHEEKSNHSQHDEHKENHSKEEINDGDHDHQEKIPHEKAKTETEDEGEGEREGGEEGEDCATDEVAATKEIVEEKQLERRQEEDDEGSQQGLESNKEEIVEGEAEESEPEAGYGKKGSPMPYNDVIEETTNQLLEERKNKVRALVGAFETVIDKQSSNPK